MATEDWLKGLFVGGLIGAVLGLLYAPKSGKETREDICKSAGDMYEKAKQQYEQARMKMDELAGSGKELYAEKREKLQKAVEAGVAAFKDEKSGAA